MAKVKHKEVADYIEPLNMNGLKGRMLRVPAPTGKKREILFVYGHHSSLERWWGVIQDLNQYGAVTMPDLPGFGGMDSFYKIGQKPSIDAMADYLATFIKLRYKHKKISVSGLSFGFVIATRMLQRYPDLVDKVDMFISVVGFSHHEDFAFSRRRYWFYRILAAFFSYRIPAFFFKNIALNPLVLRVAYHKTNNAKIKFANTDKTNHKAQMDFEIHLWHCNDVRTYMYTANQFLKVDNCNKQINLPLWHVSVKDEQYFNHYLVLQHLKVIFKKVTVVVSSMDSHAPSIIADVKAAAPLLPTKLRRVLARNIKT
ncbi:MAG: alpha/beta hydrolase [Candidatus Saccharibacteria bacterium]